ncbi:P-loop NTPase fold protein [Marinospirillum perlucidum]|uniref:P-loop NTPase fold protein n=1 Tax=Marinospirillum perlucidum TaxID=1982602 RepID=UPI000DF36FFE|nr:P-loop NTPase fold protein [Marinospirillum perlucidum]
MTTILDTDRALEDKEKDQFGFVGMAKKLAPSIVQASKGDGIVIGLEGPWGSGKTSLLNFLRAELAANDGENVHTITIAPWLNGDSSPLVSALLDPMAAILDSQIAANSCSTAGRLKESVTTASQLIRTYGSKTARSISSLAAIAGYFAPGAQAVKGVSDAVANAADQLSTPVPALPELKHEIAEKIKDLDIGFVVILDDLDRLEPEQAVEVVRLVRSVADFPRVAYLMCYDREVLAQALESGLKVSDGDLYLQKIVQLTFNLPLPEPFDLRSNFLDEAIAIYGEITGKHIEGKLLNDLRSAVDRVGMGLSTPREVKLALNSIRFVYPQVTDDVYFPDFCRLHLIKTTNYKLYQWLESYLSLRSVLVTGDAKISNDEREEIGKELKILLPSESIDSGNSIWNLKRFIPGLENSDEDDKRVFASTNPSSIKDAIELKRLGSPLHYRFYFALTGPKTVMPDNEFDGLLELARSDPAHLTACLDELAMERRTTGRTWFEHVLNRLDDQLLSDLDEKQLLGIVQALSDMMDVAIKEDGGHRAFAISLSGIAIQVAEKCLKQLSELNPSSPLEAIEYMASEGKAINWLVGEFFRFQLIAHGKIGKEAQRPEQWAISNAILDKAITILKERLNSQDTKEQIPCLPDISAYLYGWMNITNDDQAVVAWTREYSQNDEGFLRILNHLRGWVMSDKVYYPLAKSNVIRFFDWDDAITRLEHMKDGEFADEAKDLLTAIEQSRDF